MAQINKLLRAFKSVFAAFLGVQNSKNHEQDFESENPFPFIFAGIVLAIGFILLVVGVVNAVLA